MRQFSGLIVLLCTLLLSAVFMVIRKEDYTEYSFFCNDLNRLCISEIKLTFNTFVYFLFEHLILVLFALYIYMEATKFKTALKVFLWIQIIDVFDYLIAYGKTWFYIDGIPISWNLLKVSIFALAIINEVFKQIELKYQK